MIRPSIGISIITHLFIIIAFKIKKFFGVDFKSPKTDGPAASFLKKVFASLVIAAIVESVFLFVAISSSAVVSYGIKNSYSNFNLVKNAFADSSSTVEIEPGWHKNINYK